VKESLRAKPMKQIKMGAISYALMLKHMMEGVYTCQELAEFTGLHLITVYQYTREICAAGAAHICHYEPDARGRHNIKVYKLGAGKNAKKPKMTVNERMAKHREKVYQQKVMHVMAGTAKFFVSANGRQRFEMTKGKPLETSEAQT
jgi:hypothetical protein